MQHSSIVCHGNRIRILLRILENRSTCTLFFSFGKDEQKGTGEEGVVKRGKRNTSPKQTIISSFQTGEEIGRTFLKSLPSLTRNR